MNYCLISIRFVIQPIQSGIVTKKKLLIISISILYCLGSTSQVMNDITRKDLLKSIEYSNPSLISPSAGKTPGFPDRSPGLDVLPGFKNPPPGYGEVPFWLWSGDPLDKDR